MRILLLGEYSNVHHTLCEALRRAGHEVLLISDGDGWKDYPRDIDLRRKQAGPLGSLHYLARLATLLPRLRGYDVVQIINPIFLDVKARWNRWVFDYLKRHNCVMSVGCFGDDTYVIERMQDPSCFAYSDLQAYGRPIEHANNRRRIACWTQPDKAALTRYVMAHAHCLMACLYEYWRVYDLPAFRERLHYMPLPVTLQSSYSSILNSSLSTSSSQSSTLHPKTRILFAAQKSRSQMKGTDQLEPLFDRLAAAYPGQIELHKIVSVPFAEYQRLVAEADVVIDQLYSYTPAMGALESLSQGKVVVSGYEMEYAQFLHSQSVGVSDRYDAVALAKESGIINLRPFADADNYRVLEQLLLDSAGVAQLKQAALSFVHRYHDADTVAARYISVWSSANGVGVASSSSR